MFLGVPTTSGACLSTRALFNSLCPSNMFRRRGRAGPPRLPMRRRFVHGPRGVLPIAEPGLRVWQERVVVRPDPAGRVFWLRRLALRTQGPRRVRFVGRRVCEDGPNCAGRGARNGAGGFRGGPSTRLSVGFPGACRTWRLFHCATRDGTASRCVHKRAKLRREAPLTVDLQGTRRPRAHVAARQALHLHKL